MKPETRDFLEKARVELADARKIADVSNNALRQRILTAVLSDLFDVRVMGNTVRAHYVEHMVGEMLGEDFTLTKPWVGWDIDHTSGFKIEVKQSAARQIWTLPESKPSKGIFDIAERTGYFADGGNAFVKKVGRSADLYIFAWHALWSINDPIEAGDTDQRDPAQWQFLAVPTLKLPANQKTITWKAAIVLGSVVRFERLRECVLLAMGEISREQREAPSQGR